MLERVCEDLTANDMRLIEEAMRRVQLPLIDASIGRERMTDVLSEQIRRGRRDLFSLVRAGRRAIDER